jgi:uncharacterized membrane protein YdjX (TVP38/TMEM64 family)
MTDQKSIPFLRLFTLLLVTGISLGLFLYGYRIEGLEAYGYPGIFLFSLLTNATIILPIPSVVMTSVLGGVLNPFWVAIAAGAGAAIGELSGYLAGFSGRTVLQKNITNDRIVNWMKKYGGLTIFFLAIIPNPAFDLAGIIAGALKMPVQRFFLWCLLGKIIKMLIFAYGGDQIQQYYRLLQPVSP